MGQHRGSARAGDAAAGWRSQRPPAWQADWLSPLHVLPRRCSTVPVLINLAALYSLNLDSRGRSYLACLSVIYLRGLWMCVCHPEAHRVQRPQWAALQVWHCGRERGHCGMLAVLAGLPTDRHPCERERGHCGRPVRPGLPTDRHPCPAGGPGRGSL